MLGSRPRKGHLAKGQFRSLTEGVAKLRPALYTRSGDGHRSAYLNFARALLEADVTNAPTSDRRTVFFLMADDHFSHYAATAFTRALFGRRTVGFLFRPGPALAGKSARLRLKRGLLKLLKRLPKVQTLAIVPVPLAPRFGEIVDGWIYDFQLWDMDEADHETVAALRAGDEVADPAAADFYREIKVAAAGRPVLVALGMQSRNKGFATLTRAAAGIAGAGWFSFVGGRVDPVLAAEKQALEAAGARVEDRFLTDGEILAAYAAADAVWCVYDPAYDQASGILGRAVQFGCPAVVRRGSLSAALCRHEALPHLSVNSDPGAGVDFAELPARDPEGGRAAAKRFRARSLAVLSDALGMATAGPRR